MPMDVLTLFASQYLIEKRKRYSSASGNFNGLILNVGLTCKSIARTVAFSTLDGVPGNAGSVVNGQGEERGLFRVV